jgi:hypothetical protein
MADERKMACKEVDCVGSQVNTVPIALWDEFNDHKRFDSLWRRFNGEVVIEFSHWLHN